MKNPIKKVLFLSVMLALALFISVGVGVLSPQETAVAQTETAAISENTILNLIDELVEARDDAADIWNKLTPEEQKAIIEEISSWEVHSRVIKETGTKSGGMLTVEVYKGPANKKVFSYYQRIIWYWNGVTITSVQANQWPDVYLPPWTFAGDEVNQWGGSGYTYFRSRADAVFQFKIGEYVIMEEYPWIDMTVYGDGSYTYSTWAD